MEHTLVCSKVCSKSLFQKSWTFFMHSFLWCRISLKKSIYDCLSLNSILGKMIKFLTPIVEKWTKINVQIGIVMDYFFRDIERF